MTLIPPLHAEGQNFTNKAKADYFVSIHLNSSTSPSAHGTETFSFKRGTVGEKLAQKIQSHLVKSIRLANRGVKQETSLS